MITIDSKPTGETTLFIAADTIMAAIHRLDRARAALAALDDSPLPAPTEEALATLRALHAEAAAQEEAAPPVVVAQEQSQPESAPPVAIPQEEAAREEANAAALREEIATVGKQMFGEEWPQAERWLVSGWTSKRTPENIRNSPRHLTASECEAVLVGLCDNAETTRASWQKQKEADAAKARQTTPATPAQSSARPGRQPRTAASLTAPRRPAPGTAAHTAMVNGAITG